MRLSPLQDVSWLSVLAALIVACGASHVTAANPSVPDVAVSQTSPISVSPNHPHVGEPVTFEVPGSLLRDRVVADIRWRFPDGSVTSAPIQTRVQHRFPDPGVYRVSLRMTTLNPLRSFDASVTITVRPSQNTTTSAVNGMNTTVSINTPSAFDEDREGDLGGNGGLNFLDIGDFGPGSPNGFRTAVLLPAWDLFSEYVLSLLR